MFSYLCNHQLQLLAKFKHLHSCLQYLLHGQPDYWKSYPLYLSVNSYLHQNRKCDYHLYCKIIHLHPLIPDENALLLLYEKRLILFHRDFIFRQKEYYNIASFLFNIFSFIFEKLISPAFHSSTV